MTRAMPPITAAELIQESRAVREREDVSLEQLADATEQVLNLVLQSFDYRADPESFGGILARMLAALAGQLQDKAAAEARRRSS